MKKTSEWVGPVAGIVGTLKQELVYQQQFATRDEAKTKLFEYNEVSVTVSVDICRRVYTGRSSSSA